MSELPGGPDDAEELIACQYSDRPGLRPVLDAVLAALPALGPVTVQARKTLVSLSTPRRVFAVVQAEDGAVGEELVEVRRSGSQLGETSGEVGLARARGP